jgi:hypothetical protein
MKSKVAALSAVFMMAGCASTTKIPITVTHPAEINMSAYKQIAIGEFSGAKGQELADELKENLVNDPSFKVVDRSQLNQILGELQLSQSDLADSASSRAKLGKLLGATVLLTGKNIEVNYSDKTTYENRTCTRIISQKKSEEYPCKQYTRVCGADNSGSIDVVDVQSGQIIKSRRLKGGYSLQTSAVDAIPACEERGDVERKALSSEISVFLKTIKPWRETVLAAFAKDSAIPSLEEGIKTAQMGDMKEAAKVFQMAAKSAETTAAIKPASIAKAYWNLGLALEYSGDYDQSLAALKKAYMIKSVPEYLAEQANVQRLRKEANELKNQNR